MGRAIRFVLIGCGGLSILAVVGIVLVVLLAPAEDVSDTPDNSDTSQPEAISDESFDNANYGELAADPGSHEGAAVDVMGQLFGAPEPDGESVAFQMWSDPQNAEWNTVVYADAGTFPEDLAADDYVRVRGVAGGVFEGENAFGAGVDAPIIEAESVESVPPMEAIDPTLRTLQVNQTEANQGLSITLERIEFGKESTRVYVTVTNGTSAPASLYTFNANIIQGSTQIDVADAFEYEIEEPQSELAPGVESEGTVVFGQVDRAEPFTVRFEWSSENFDVTEQPITFDVTP